MQPLDDTIVALASAPGGAARGIVRVSGPEAVACVGAFFETDGDTSLAAIDAPTAVAGRLRLEGLDGPLPCDLYFWPVGRSYTGQPVVELHTLGSPPLLEATAEGLCRVGARPAGPGEFTLRAFLAGRIDLTQAEAVLGVIDAADEGQLRDALEQLAGGLSRPLSELRDWLLDLLSELEAGLDFADEDLESIAPGAVAGQLADAAHRVAAIAEQMHSRTETADRPRVVLCGAANAGKSSLFNALLGRSGAIVADAPGTTRDYLAAPWELGGRHIDLIDTAGATESSFTAPDDIHRQAQAHTETQSRRAELRLLCIDAGRPLSEEAQRLLRETDGALRLVVLTKCDLPREIEEPPGAICTSSTTGQGLAALGEAVERALGDLNDREGSAVASTAARCRQSLRRAGDDLDRARSLAGGQGGEELIAAEVRAALDELGKVVGAVYTDDVLDRIFSRFCIGK